MSDASGRSGRCGLAERLEARSRREAGETERATGAAMTWAVAVAVSTLLVRVSWRNNSSEFDTPEPSRNVGCRCR